jgi:predicted DCC family thiol-disulfide oxidoreductase YuxK
MKMMVGPTFVYDGDCAFCTSCVRFIERYGLRRRGSAPVRLVPWQFADLPALGLSVAQCEEAVQWVDPDGDRADGPEAISALLGVSAGAWRPVGWILARGPVLALARPAYRWVARNRHRMPGGTAACSVPYASRDRHDDRA